MKLYFGEQGYIDLLKDVLENGVETKDRTGIGCIKVFDRKLIWNVGEQFPFSTFRPAPLRMAFEEFWMFMRGETQTKYLEAKKINFWKGNTSREFLDSRGLKYLPEGDMGKAYGYQWRKYDDILDQLELTYETLKNDPFSRRIYTTFWNPVQSKDMALTPCWHSHQFIVIPEKDGTHTLNLKLFSRSLDLAFGESFARQQYALYLMCMAKLLNMNVGYMSCDLTDVHIYKNQIAFVKEMVNRDLGKVGTVTINKNLDTLDDMVELEWDDIEVDGLEVNKEPFKTERPPMAV